MTKRDVFVEARDMFAEGSEQREVMEKAIAQLDKKSSKPTKAQIENLGIKNEILAVIADGHARTAKEIAEEVGYSVAKVSALLRQIVADEKAEKVPGEKSKDAPKYVGNEEATPYEV
jgi:predicted HTH transcriptional regulator